MCFVIIINGNRDGLEMPGRVSEIHFLVKIENESHYLQNKIEFPVREIKKNSVKDYNQKKITIQNIFVNLNQSPADLENCTWLNSIPKKKLCNLNFSEILRKKKFSISVEN